MYAPLQLYGLSRAAPVLLDVACNTCAFPNLAAHFPASLAHMSAFVASATTLGAPQLVTDRVPELLTSPNVQICAVMLANMTCIGVALPIVVGYLSERGARSGSRGGRPRAATGRPRAATGRPAGLRPLLRCD
jgi:hypothetical protein